MKSKILNVVGLVLLAVSLFSVVAGGILEGSIATVFTVTGILELAAGGACYQIAQRKR